MDDNIPENESDIQTFLDSLPKEEESSFNHETTIWKTYINKPPPKRHVVPVTSPERINPSKSQNNSTSREFLVTHTSDNWKIRKAARQASLEQPNTVTNEPEINDHVSAVEHQNNSLPEESQKTDDHRLSPSHTPISPTNGTVNHSPSPTSISVHDTHGQEQPLDGFLARVLERERAILPTMSPIDDGLKYITPDDESFKKVRHAKEEGEHTFRERYDMLPNKERRSSPTDHLETDTGANKVKYRPSKNVQNVHIVYGEEPVDIDDETTESSNSSETDEFDTDLSDNEGKNKEQTEDQTENPTLKAYKIACAKCHLKPNASFLRQCHNVHIDVRNRMLSYKDAKPIAIALVTDSKTEYLDMSENPLGPLGTAYIAEMMYANESIVELLLSNIDLGREGLRALVQTLGHNKELRRLNLDNNKLQQGDGELVADLIVMSTNLRELSLNNNSLGFDGIKRIAQALAADRGRLSTLHLEYNNIRTEAAVTMAVCLAQNTTLRILNLAWNGFGVDGCRALAKALAVNTTLEELDLTSNRLGLQSLEHLIEGLNNNSGLKSVKLGTNPLTTDGVRVLINAIKNGTDSVLEELDITNIPIDTNVIKAADSLKEFRVIQIYHDVHVHIATKDQHKDADGSNLDSYDPAMVLFEYMKKDNLRVIDLFQFFDSQKRDKLSKKNIRDGVNILMIPFTEHNLDQIMKTINTSRSGFITLEEMMKAYKESDRAVKLRRIKANQKKKPDKALEYLWELVKDIILKRKAVNEKKSMEKNEAKLAAKADEARKEAKNVKEFMEAKEAKKEAAASKEGGKGDKQEKGKEGKKKKGGKKKGKSGKKGKKKQKA